MYDYSKLKGRIVEMKMTQNDLAEEIQIAKSTLNLKLNNKISFSQDDIIAVSKVLLIPKEVIGIYFFTEEV